jgi:beta-glucosidase-like glycosyl hydrolase
LGLARLAVLAGALALTGCVTTENRLSKDDAGGMKLTGINVSFAPNANVEWEDGIRAYAKAKAIPDDQIGTAVNTPEGKAYLNTMLASQIKSRTERRMVGALTGSRPVRLDIVVRDFTVLSPVKRVLIGGGHLMIADASLVDARTGTVIVAHPDLRGGVMTGNGLVGTPVSMAIESNYKESIAEKMMDAYAENYRYLLLPKPPE